METTADQEEATAGWSPGREAWHPALGRVRVVEVHPLDGRATLVRPLDERSLRHVWIDGWHLRSREGAVA